MKKLISTCAIAASLVSSAFSLEFGTMGSQSFGMAGTGVAVKKSHWGLYYNPALIVADSGFKLGLYAGLHTRSKNFWESLDQFNTLSKQNINGLQASANTDAIKLPLQNISQLLEDNRIAFKNQDGIVLQAPDFGLGALAIGAFLNLSGGGSLKAHGLADLMQNHNTSTTTATSSTTTTTPTQIPQAEVNFSSYALIEIPVGYAYEFDTDLGYLGVGVALKYMNLSGTQGNFQVSDNTNWQASASNFLDLDLHQNASNIGLDVGITYEPTSFITLGLVGKYLNAPTFDLHSRKITIKPQARAGIGLNTGIWTLALDADLTKNEDLGSKIKNQMISLGTTLDFKLFALRAGVATDLQNKDDLIFALGLGLTVFDIGVQFGKKTSPFNGRQIPDYVSFQAGVGFSF